MDPNCHFIVIQMVSNGLEVNYCNFLSIFALPTMLYIKVVQSFFKEDHLQTWVVDGWHLFTYQITNFL